MIDNRDKRTHTVQDFCPTFSDIFRTVLAQFVFVFLQNLCSISKLISIKIKINVNRLEMECVCLRCYCFFHRINYFHN